MENSRFIAIHWDEFTSVQGGPLYRQTPMSKM